MSTPGPLLPLSLLPSNRESFNALFYEPETSALQAKTNLYLHILRVQNGDFDLPSLYGALKNNSVAYVLSRLNYEKILSDPGRMVEVVNKVQSQFRKPDAKSGEGGEVILYSLLEGHLGAPKVLSKMELKTSSQHYVHGSDGVHLLHMGENSYQLIFGESKMYGDAKDKPGGSARRGIEAAFDSIAKVHNEGLDFETWLVQSELLKERLDEASVATLLSILLPSARGTNSTVTKANSFGIFVGYEIDLTDVKFEELTLPGTESLIRERASDAIKAEQDTIKNEIINRGLGSYPFHIYAIPFTKRTIRDEVHGIEKVRMDLAAQLGQNGNSAS
ncbi:HamA C-terminal domain-containing protein [Rhodococcus qingshengii]|uniref:HamA C-terminal domain-containing protein n=1 Tax=Rhodococcus qingshengii TaxID=334542 RepID=UPI001C23DFCD|nr:DUF1837 domain-containing protein [Rhodococcus qingshengii]QXC46898.1 DUF1837 domain-containing protein [Rhodococcus qingshengii]